MTNRLNYLHDEWVALARTPVFVATAIMGAGQTSQVQLAKELVAIQGVIRLTTETEGGAELIRALITETEAQAGELYQREAETVQFARARERALEGCRQVASILGAKAPAEEAEEYRRWVLWIGRSVARAASEGDGRSGPVSAEEGQLLAEIDGALSGAAADVQPTTEAERTAQA